MMPSFLRRLKYYGIGFSLGLLFVFFFFKNRGCSWLPGNRVKNSILERLVVVSEKERLKIESKGFKMKDIVNALNHGSVHFSESKRHGTDKIYLISKKDQRRGDFKCFFNLPHDSFLAEVFWADKPVSKIRISQSGYGKFVHFPKDDHLVYIDSNKTISCQLNALQIHAPNQILNLLKRNGQFDFKQTNLTTKQKPIHCLVFSSKSYDRIRIFANWYKNKIHVTSFLLPFRNKCN